MNSNEILIAFKKQFGHLKKFGLQINGIANLVDDFNVISVSTPFIFDHRQLPNKFMGLDVRNSTSEKDLPKEFQNIDPQQEYLWAYQRFEKFVDKNVNLIRNQLDKPDMTRDEMLDALCFGDFNRHKEKCILWEGEGMIPKWLK